VDTMGDDDTGRRVEAGTRRIAPPITLKERLERPLSPHELELVRVLNLLREGTGQGFDATDIVAHPERAAPSVGSDAAPGMCGSTLWE
jgi:hypothetical protein